MKIRIEWLCLCAAALVAPELGLAQVPSPEANFPPESPAARAPSLALAQEAAEAAVLACRARGLHVSVSVVDSAGVLKVLLADDGADQRAVLSSTGKALAANDFKMPSAQVKKVMETDATVAQRIGSNPKYFPGSGALPMLVDGTVIGAIGVGGAHVEGQDESCARAGLEKVQARLR